MSELSHTRRIRNELVAAGMNTYGLGKAASRYLPRVIHDTEHIGGVVYGRYENGSAMLVATDKRIIFLDKKPLFTTNEEVTYDVVSGFKMHRSGVLSSVTLHTKVKDFKLRYVNRTCAINFRKYLEKRHLEDGDQNNLPTINNEQAESLPFLTPEAVKFLLQEGIGVLSTSSKTGVVHGAVVYYVLDDQHRMYILTKAETTKARNIIAHPQVALTVFNADNAQTLQMHGTAKIETREAVKQNIFNKIMKPHKYKGGYRLPPVAWLEAGMFVIITVTVESSNFADFSKKS